MKSIITIILITGTLFSCAPNRAIMTTVNGKTYLKDEKTSIVYEVHKDVNKYYIIKDGKRQNVYRREPKATKGAAEFSTTKN